ncbi:hypothetical protein HK405_003809 [Cladochytrium tenue]|nr:hypothetical protein HK405_003809 [Cladochytrium tenue]
MASQQGLSSGRNSGGGIGSGGHPQAPPRSASAAASPHSHGAGADTVAAPAPHARFTATCLVLGRPPSSAFLVNCGDGSGSLTQLVDRLDSILRPGAAANDNGSTPNRTDSSAPRTTLQLFRVVDAGSGAGSARLNLASPALDPADGRIRKVFAKTDPADPAARAQALSAWLGGACVWVTGAMLDAAVRDVLGVAPPSDNDDLGLDFLVVLDDPADPNVSAALPSYDDIARLGQLPPPPQSSPSVVAKHITGAGSGGVLFPQEPDTAAPADAAGAPRDVGWELAATPAVYLVAPTADKDLSQPVQDGAAAANFKRRRWVILGIIVAAVVLVLVVAISVGVVLANRKSANSEVTQAGAQSTSSGATSDGSAAASATTLSSGDTQTSAVTNTGSSSSGESGSLGQSAASTTQTDAPGQTSSTATQSGTLGQATTSTTGNAVVTSSKTTSTTSASPTATCTSFYLDSFTGTTNNLGLSTGDSGTLKSYTRTGSGVSFVPYAGDHWYYEALKYDSNGNCGSPPPSYAYLIFTISGAGTAKLNLRTGCEGGDNITPSFAATSSAVTYSVDILKLLGGDTSLAADMYSVDWESFTLTSSSATWTLSGIYLLNDLAACGISATPIN